ncbi:MAG: sulfatase-like hydrolase/transferase [Candidatus Krumholzibacteriia bacterium]
MVRWLRAATASTVWAFLLTGLLGALDAGVQLARSGLPQPAPPLGALGAVLAALTLNGWFGAVVAMAAFLGLALPLRRRPDAPALAARLAVAIALGLLVALILGSLVHDRPPSYWWRAHLGTLWLPKLLLAGGLAAAAAAALRRPAGRLLGGPTWRLYLPLVVMAAGTLLWPDGRALARRHHLAGLTAGTAPAGAPNVVLLCIDTLRRDKLSCLAQDAPPTPNLDALAAEGRLFANAWSVSSWTVPAMSTVMTGLPPRALGVGRETGLPPTAATLAGVAWRAGWTTAAVVANPYLGEAFGFTRGFADFEHSDVLEPLVPAAVSTLAREATRYVVGATDPSDGHAVVAAARRWLARRPNDRPFFLWLHFMDPHLPYRSHPDAQGRMPELPDDPLLIDGRFTDVVALREHLADVAPAVRQSVEALYDGEVRHADACVGELMATLQAAGLMDETWVVVLADHGEEFFEHGGFEHGHSLLPEVTGVPLIVRPPGGLVGGGVRDDRAVSLLDVAPSLAAALGWELPDHLPGRAWLTPDTTVVPDGPAELRVLEGMLYGPPQQATLRWPDFAVVDLESGRHAWYQLATDPGARQPTNAPPDSVDLRRRRRELLAGWDDLARELGAADRTPTALDEAARRRLRSLGY